MRKLPGLSFTTLHTHPAAPAPNMPLPHAKYIKSGRRRPRGCNKFLARGGPQAEGRWAAVMLRMDQAAQDAVAAGRAEDAAAEAARGGSASGGRAHRRGRGREGAGAGVLRRVAGAARRREHLRGAHGGGAFVTVPGSRASPSCLPGRAGALALSR